MLKAQLHTHTASDPRDRWISYSDKELIGRAAEKGFDVLAITCHGKVVFSEELRRYAERKKILLIPGIEVKIERRDVLIINASKKAEKLKTFKDLKKYKYKNPGVLVIAPHPYFKLHSLGEKLEQKLNLFDAVEYSYFYSNRVNLNKRAEKLGLPVVGTADLHFIEFLESTYALIDAEKDAKSVVRAIKNGNVKVRTSALSLPRMAKIWTKMETLGLKSLVIRNKKCYNIQNAAVHQSNT